MRLLKRIGAVSYLLLAIALCAFFIYAQREYTGDYRFIALWLLSGALCAGSLAFLWLHLKYYHPQRWEHWMVGIATAILTFVALPLIAASIVASAR